MDPLLLLLGAIFAPVTFGLLSMLPPRRAIAARVALAVAGPAVGLLAIGLFLNAHGANLFNVPAPDWAAQKGHDKAHDPKPGEQALRHGAETPSGEPTAEQPGGGRGLDHVVALAASETGGVHPGVGPRPLDPADQVEVDHDDADHDDAHHAGAPGDHADHGAHAIPRGGLQALDPEAELSASYIPDVELRFQLNADQLGLFFALLVLSIGLLITLYARAYFGPDAAALFRFLPSLHLFMTAMVGVALSDSFILMLLFWELTSISSFLLIGWERDDPGAVRKAMQAFIVTGLGGLTLMGGLILLGVTTGVWSFSELAATPGAITPTGPVIAAFALMFVGAAAKSAQFPLHFWLPGAMAAPTPVSAYLHSATMVKAGVYLTGRLWPIFAGQIDLWWTLLVPLGAITMVYGAFIALQRTDLKQIFAYTTVSQLGLLMTMYGLAAWEYHQTPNLIWDVTQILNHALYKAPLFILAGAIGHVASRELPELRGFYHRGGTERIMTIVLLLAGYALAAGPLTLSFSAKEMFFYQIAHAFSASGYEPGFYLLIAAGVATGMFNVAIFIRLATTLLGRPIAAAAPTRPGGEHDPHQLAADAGDPHASHDHDDHDDGHAHGGHDHHHETGLWPAFLWIPGLVIVAGQYLFGLVPGAYEALLGWLEPSKYYYTFGLEPGTLPMLWHATWGLPLAMSLVAIALGLGLGFSPLLRKPLRDIFDQGYNGFYWLVTQKVGPGAFGLVQRGHAGFYVAIVTLGLIVFLVFAATRIDGAFDWPEAASWDLHHPGHFALAAAATGLAVVAALLMPLVRNRASRVLVLGAVGFAVAAFYYLYRAPDLALTQLSIEIVSLVLFLLVLSLLPDYRESPPRHLVWRLPLSIVAGLVMFWVVLHSTVGDRPNLGHQTVDGQPITTLGDFFVRNSYKGMDTIDVPESTLPRGVVDRGPGHPGGFHTGDSKSGSHDHGGDHDAGGPSDAGADGERAAIHKGGGGGNVVNVILVDFRGFDTMGEIVVLGLAALGVWTLLRRPGRERPGDAAAPGSQGNGAAP